MTENIERTDKFGSVLSIGDWVCFTIGSNLHYGRIVKYNQVTIKVQSFNKGGRYEQVDNPDYNPPDYTNPNRDDDGRVLGIDPDKPVNWNRTIDSEKLEQFKEGRCFNVRHWMRNSFPNIIKLDGPIERMVIHTNLKEIQSAEISI